MAMSFTGSKSKKQNGRIEEGVYGARIVQLIDLGLQKTEWQGEEKINHKVRITFEFPTERVSVEDADKPRWLGKDYTVSMHEKSQLFALVKAADPDGKLTNNGRNPKGILGAAVMVEVGSTSTGNAKVSGTTRLMKGMSVGELENPTVFFDMSDPSTYNVYDTLPKWMQETIQGGVDFDSTPFFRETVEEVPY